MYGEIVITIGVSAYDLFCRPIAVKTETGGMATVDTSLVGGIRWIIETTQLPSAKIEAVARHTSPRRTLASLIDRAWILANEPIQWNHPPVAVEKYARERHLRRPPEKPLIVPTDVVV